MSRSGYCEDYDDYNCMNLYRGSVYRAFKGKRGKKFLIELAAAMDVMSEKRLIAQELVTAQGECCTIGVLCKAKNIDVSHIDVEDAELIAANMDIATSMAREIEYMNDEYGPSKETPEERWIRMRAWVQKCIEEPGEVL